MCLSLFCNLPGPPASLDMCLSLFCNPVLGSIPWTASTRSIATRARRNWIWMRPFTGDSTTVIYRPGAVLREAQLNSSAAPVQSIAGQLGAQLGALQVADPPCKQRQKGGIRRPLGYPRVPGFTPRLRPERGNPSSVEAVADHGGQSAVIDGSPTESPRCSQDVVEAGGLQGQGGMGNEEQPSSRAKWFPYLDEFRLNEESPILSSKVILEMLEPFLVDGRRQRIEGVVANRTYTVCPVVEGLLDPGNVAAVFRSADALGYQSVHVVSNRVNKRYRKNRRVSVGAEKWLDVESWASTASCVEALRARGYRIAVTHIAPDTISIHDMDWTIPTAVIFGNEDEGISQEAISLSDVRCSIPMTGMVDSFNVSVAAGILMHYAAFDRVSRLGCHGDLLPEEQQILTAEFCMRHSHHIPGIIDRLLDKSYSSRQGSLGSILKGELEAGIEDPECVPCSATGL